MVGHKFYVIRLVRGLSDLLGQSTCTPLSNSAYISIDTKKKYRGNLRIGPISPEGFRFALDLFGVAVLA